ncbi:MAG: hypothetical protein IPM34_14310 [Saprospiraceae bacterium]|nr:hypothetical protein [Saprospiraceae bacterium]
MNSIFNEDFLEYLELLHKYSVRYILVGGLAVNIYGYRRSTGDMAIWIEPTIDNHSKLIQVHVDFKMQMGAMGELDNFLNTSEFDVFQFGGGFVKIDVMTACKGLDFNEAYNQANLVTIENVNIRVLHLNQLIEAKLASARFKDLDDVENLKQIHSSGS